MRGELLNLENCDPAVSQQVRREIARIATTTKACLAEKNQGDQFKLATALYIRQKTGFVPIGRDEHGIYVPGMRVMSKMVEAIALNDGHDIKAKLKEIIDEALRDRDWVWKNPLLTYI